jgi:hypothetical protein
MQHIVNEYRQYCLFLLFVSLLYWGEEASVHLQASDELIIAILKTDKLKTEQIINNC